MESFATEPIAAGIYLQARLVSPRIPEKGALDIAAIFIKRPWVQG